MNISKWIDTEITPHYMRDEADPYSLPIVVRVEKGETYTTEDAYTAVIKLMVELFSTDKWDDALKLWMKGRIRKVTRRARASAWENLKTLDHLYVKHNNVEMMVFEPHRLEELNPQLKKLQVQGIELEPTKIMHNATREGFNYAVNPTLTMSTGKTIAQVAHSVQVLILNSKPEVLKVWEQQGFPITQVNWNLLNNPQVSIQDAGLTEIPAGSYTVKAQLV